MAGNLSSRRANQVSSEIRAELSNLILREVRDPRLTNVGMITLSGIDMADDYLNATVWVSFMGKDKDSAEVKEALKALQSASSFLHRMIMKRIPMKVHPQFYFKYDPMFDKAEQIHKAFLELDEKDGKTKKVASNDSEE